MKATTIFQRFNLTIDRWDEALAKYSSQDFRQKPDPAAWSVGQVYEHITASTLNFHIKQIEHCLSTNENAEKRKRFLASFSLLVRKIPPIKIQIPPEENFEPKQPENPQVIRERFKELRYRFFRLVPEMDRTRLKGKTFHPGMGYLNAKEWFELIDLHFGYHWRDKKKVDRYLKQSRRKQNIVFKEFTGQF